MRGNRSELVQEIINKEASYSGKWIIVSFLLLFLLLFAAGWWIQYPDIIEATAFLTADNAPKEIVVRQQGRLVSLLVHNGDEIKPSQAIGWIESVANPSEVIALSINLDSCERLLQEEHCEKIGKMFDSRCDNMGEIQNDYRQFLAALRQFEDYMINGFYLNKKRLLEGDIQTLRKMRQALFDEKGLVDEDEKIAGESFKMNSLLLDQKVLSSEEFRVQESRYFGKEMAGHQLTVQLLSNETQERTKVSELNQLEHDIEQQKVIFQQALESLRSVVADWVNKYVVKAPIGGRVSFATPVQEGQFLQDGKLLGYVIPVNAVFYAQATLPQNNFGKIDTGLHVQLRFDAYPYREFGYVHGSLDYVSGIASDSGFLAYIRFDDGLKTNYGFPIQYKNGLKARAIVVTREMNLLKRFYSNIIRGMSPNK